MSYFASYRITPSILGYWIEQPKGGSTSDGWEAIHGKPAFETREKAEEALRRWRKEKPSYYDENGEAV